MNELKLISMAANAMQTSYSPYSDFKVGAALLCDDDSVYVGCNVENASYGATVCAERTAFLKAVSDGKRKFSKIAIVGGLRGDIDSPCYPCGICRQFMAEFCDGEFEIVTVKNGQILKNKLSELLPFRFNV